MRVSVYVTLPEPETGVDSPSLSGPRSSSHGSHAGPSEVPAMPTRAAGPRFVAVATSGLDINAAAMAVLVDHLGVH